MIYADCIDEGTKVLHKGAEHIMRVGWPEPACSEVIISFQKTQAHLKGVN